MNLTWLIPTLSLTLAAAGVALLAWSLFWDRARGQKRCPKCWYDMAGAPTLLCPECGHDARREGRLLKTRRRWGWAAVGCVLVGAAGEIHAGPQVRERGVRAIIPTRVLVHHVPMPDRAHDWQSYQYPEKKIWFELRRRRESGILSVTSERILMRRFASAYGGDFQQVLETREAWLVDHPIWCRVTPQWWMQGEYMRTLIIRRLDEDAPNIEVNVPSRSVSSLPDHYGLRYNWHMNMHTFGHASPNLESLTFEVSLLERPRGTGPGGFVFDDGGIVWSTVVEIPLSVTDDVDAIVAPVQVAEFEGRLVHSATASLVIHPNHGSASVILDAPWADLAAALGEIGVSTVARLILEIERDREIVAKAYTGVSNSDRLRFAFGNPRNGRRHVPLSEKNSLLYAPDIADSTWNIRIRGAGARAALGYFHVTHRWEGEIVVPIESIRVRHSEWQDGRRVEEHIEFMSSGDSDEGS